MRQQCARDAGVLAFTAHSVVFTDEDEGWVRATLSAVGCDPLAAAMNPGSSRRSWSGRDARTTPST